MEKNIFDIPMELTGLEKIPVPTTYDSSGEIVNSEASENTNANNLTEYQKIGVEAKIERAIENMGSVKASNDDYNELWSYDDFDNAYNSGISYEEKQAFTFWIENKLGRRQTGFFARYSLNRTPEEIQMLRNSDDGLALEPSVYKRVVKLMEAGALFFDLTNNEYCPKYIFTTGNLWRKRNMMIDGNEGDKIKEIFGEEAYYQHKTAMESAFLKVYSNRIKLSGVDLDKCLNIDINSDIAKNVKIKEIILPDGKKVREKFKVAKNNRGGLDFTKGRGAKRTGRAEEHTFKELSLREAFIYWLRKSVRDGNTTGINMFGMDWLDVYNQYYLRNKKGLGGLDPNEKFKRQEQAVRIGMNIFSDFLQRGISGQAKLLIETMWNEKYNHFPNIWDESKCEYVGGIDNKEYLEVDGTKVAKVTGQVPIGFQMAKRYGGKQDAPYLIDIRTEKRRSLSFNTITQFQSLLAYGVGVGKTWCAIYQVAQALELGICKRPIFVLPNQVYPQFVKEIKSILPQYKVNALYNLSGAFLEMAENIEDNTITCITETGLEKIAYSEEYQERGFTDDAMITLQQFNTGKLTEADREKIGKTYDEILSPLIKGKPKMDEFGEPINKKILADKVRFDYIVVDEAHNYKKLITSVVGKIIEEALETEMDAKQLQQREPTQFQFGGGSPTSRALRLFFLIDYIQQTNVFGNTLLLTATPFTNNPLEVWSMMTYVDREMLINTGLDASIDFFRVFGDMQFTAEATIGARIKEKFNFVGWKNVPALQNLIFSRIDYISPDEMKLPRPNKIVFPLKSITNGQTMEVRRLSQSEQISSILTMEGKQKELIEDMKEYANGTIEWMPKLWEEITREDSQGNKTKEMFPFDQSYVNQKCREERFIACEENWNLLNEPYYTKNGEAQGLGIKKLKWLVGEHELKGKKKVTIKGNVVSPNGRVEGGNLQNGYEEELIRSLFPTSKSTALLRSLVYQRQITISPYLVPFSGYKEMPTPKEFIDSSVKLKYVMGCIASVKKHHEETNTQVSGQIIHIEFGIQAFPIIAQYCIDELGFKPSEVGIICGDASLTRTMDSFKKNGKPAPMNKKLVQDRFNGLKLNAQGEYEPIDDDMRVKVLIGSETIQEGMNLQFRSSAIYQCTIGFLPTAQTQLEGRVWRQGNPYKFVRIVNPLCADSIDVFMFQKMQDKTKHINQIWNRDGQTFALDTREFSASELKEACISNPYQLAMFQADEIEKEIQNEISEIQFQKSKYDKIQNLIALKNRLIFTNGESSEINGLRFLRDAIIVDLYEWCLSSRPDLIEEQLLNKQTIVQILKELSSQKLSGNQTFTKNVLSDATLDGTEFSYTIVEILTIVAQIFKERKYTLPFGFSKSATEAVKEGDRVSFQKRGQTYEGIIKAVFDGEEYDVVLDDGKELEISKDNNNVAKIVEVTEDEKRTFGFGTNELVNLAPSLYEYTKASEQRYGESFTSFVDRLFNKISDDDGSLPEDGELYELLDGMDLSPKTFPVSKSWSALFGGSSWSYQITKTSDEDSEDNSKINYQFRNRLDSPKKMAKEFQSQIKGSYNNRYEPTWKREIEQADNEFERVLVPEGITTPSLLAEKIKSYDAEIQRLNSEMKNVKNGERIKERATEIVRKRIIETANTDNGLKEGDWEDRVKAFATLNCLLDMMADAKPQKIEVRKKEETPVTERTDELADIQERIDGLKFVLEITDEDSEEYADIQERIEGLEFAKEILEE